MINKITLARVVSFTSEIRNLSQNHQLSWFLRLIVTTFIIIWLLIFIDFGEFLQVALKPNWMPLLAMVLSAWLFVLIGAVQLWILFRALTPIPFHSFIGYFLLATSIGAFTPASLGDFSLAAFLRREQVPASQSTSILLVDRAVTLSVNVMLFLPLMLGLLLKIDHVWWIPVLFLAGLFLLVAINNTLLKRYDLSVWFSKFSFLENVVKTISTLLHNRPVYLFGNIGLTIFRAIVAGIVVQFALWAAGEPQSFLPVLVTTNSITVLNLLPISLAGLGVYEGGGTAILSQFGFNEARVFAAFMYQRIYIVIYSLLMIFLSRMFLNRLQRWSAETKERSR